MNELEREQVARNITRLLRETGYTQAGFAELVGVTTVTVNRWAKGRTAITEYSAREINRHFPDYSIDYLRGLTPYPDEDAAVWGELDEAANEARAFETLVERSGYTMWPTDCGTVRLYDDKGSAFEITGGQYNDLRYEVCCYIKMRLDLMADRGQE